MWLEPELVSARDAGATAELDRIIVPGREARKEGRALARAAEAVGAPAPEYLHVENAERFSLEPVLEDLARTADIATATFAQHRLEYRSSTLHPSGNLFPFAPLLSVVGLGFLGALLCGSVAGRLRARGRARSGATAGEHKAPPAVAMR